MTYKNILITLIFGALLVIIANQKSIVNEIESKRTIVYDEKLQTVDTLHTVEISDEYKEFRYVSYNTAKVYNLYLTEGQVNWIKHSDHFYITFYSNGKIWKIDDPGDRRVLIDKEDLVEQINWQ